MNQVSECCHREITTKHGREFPLGGVTWGIATKEEVCTCCGKDCSPVDECEGCGVVGCSGNCIVDISESIVCPQCDEQTKELLTLTQFLTERATVDIQVCPTCYDRISNS